MIRATFFSFLVVFSAIGSLYGQLIDNARCNAFTDNPFFNAEIVRLNKLKALHGSISTKKELSAIKKTGKVLNYTFDKNGNLTQQYSSFYRGKRKDTTFIYFMYDHQNSLITKRTNDINGFYSYNYGYNAKKQVIKKTYCRDENATKSRKKFTLGKQYVIINETYSYQDNDSIVIKSVLNNNGLPYQKITYRYNSLGYLVLETKKLLLNNKKSTVSYQYNQHGLLKAKKTIRDLKKGNFKKSTYKYDKLGNLVELNEYNNDQHITHKEILYDQKTFLLKALIVQDVETNFIKIIKFKPSFYN